jgi:anti-sigma-K factor RskA
MMNEKMSPQNPDQHDDTVRDELGDALGARDADEADAFADTAAELAMQLPPVPPQPSSKAALFARIDALSERERVEPEAAERATLQRAGSDATHSISRGQRARRFRRPVFVTAAIVAAVALFFAGFASRGLFAVAHPTQTASADPVTLILAQPDARHATHPLSTRGTATLVWSAHAGRAAVILDKAGPAPSGKTYELWFVRSGAAIAAGTMSASTTAPSIRQLTGPMESGDSVAITIEPAEGTSQPTTTPIVLIPTDA